MQVRAVSGSWGGGITGAGSFVTLVDNFDFVNPYVFDGAYFKVSAGLAAGVGYGFNLIIMGGARSPGSFDWQFGVDASAGVGFGKSQVISSKVVPCSCE